MRCPTTASGQLAPGARWSAGTKPFYGEACTVYGVPERKIKSDEKNREEKV